MKPCVAAPPPGETCNRSRSGLLYKCRHAIRLEMQKKKRKKKTAPVRVVGVPESGNNPSPKRTKVEPHFTATFPSWRTSAQHLDDSRGVPNPPEHLGCFQLGGSLSGILTNLTMLSLGSKKKEAPPRVEQLPQVKRFHSHLSRVFCVITRDQFRLERRDLGSFQPSVASLETLQQFNFLKSARL